MINERTGQRTISSINKNNKINYTNYYYYICNCIYVYVFKLLLFITLKSFYYQDSLNKIFYTIHFNCISYIIA